MLFTSMVFYLYLTRSGFEPKSFRRRYRPDDYDHLLEWTPYFTTKSITGPSTGKIRKLKPILSLDASYPKLYQAILLLPIQKYKPR